jgi:hypothetical protein
MQCDYCTKEVIEGRNGSICRDPHDLTNVSAICDTCEDRALEQERGPFEDDGESPVCAGSMTEAIRRSLLKES